MIMTGQEDKERAVLEKIAFYMKHGYKKSVAVRKVMVDFSYATEASIYGILRRNKNNNNGK